MKKTPVLTTLGLTTALALSSQANSADFGLTVAFSENTEVRVPIKLDGYVIEPYLGYVKYKGNTYEFADNLETFNIGLGLWRTAQLAENLQALYGLQVGLVDGKGSLIWSSSDTEQSGYEVNPGVGIFYSFNDNLQIGAEVKYAYSNIDTKYDYPEINSKEINGQTVTGLVARFYF